MNLIDRCGVSFEQQPREESEILSVPRLSYRETNQGSALVRAH